MKFEIIGNLNNPLIMMLTGSFYPSSGLKYLYEKLKDDYCLILPEYNGHLQQDRMKLKNS